MIDMHSSRKPFSCVEGVDFIQKACPFHPRFEDYLSYLSASIKNVRVRVISHTPIYYKGSGFLSHSLTTTLSASIKNIRVRVVLYVIPQYQKYKGLGYLSHPNEWTRTEKYPLMRCRRESISHWI